MVGVEIPRLHHVHGAVEPLAHELGVGVVPGDDGVETLVELEPGVDGVQADAVSELAQPPERSLALWRGEVVEDAPGHQEVSRLRTLLGFDLGKRQSSVEREIDVVA